jgi:hypothetical protein
MTIVQQRNAENNSGPLITRELDGHLVLVTIKKLTLNYLGVSSVSDVMGSVSVFFLKNENDHLLRRKLTNTTQFLFTHSLSSP